MLVVTSEHEGFCVPVVEAMAAGVPVVAFDRARCPRFWAGPASSSRTRTPTRWPPPSPLSCATRPAATVRSGRSGAPDLAAARDRCRPLRRAAGPAGRGGCDLVVTGIHQFVPMLHRADAVGRHTLRLRDVMVATGHRLAHLCGDGRCRHELRDPAVHPVRRGGRGRRRPRLPIRHGLGHGRLAPRPSRTPGRELPQRDAAGVLRALGQRDGTAPAAGADAAAAAGAPSGARPRRVLLQRSGVATGRLPPHRRRTPGRHGRDHDGDAAPSGVARRRTGRRTLGQRGTARPEQSDRVGRHGVARGARPRRRRGHTAVGGPVRRAVLHRGAAPLRRRIGSARRRGVPGRAQRCRVGRRRGRRRRVRAGLTPRGLRGTGHRRR